MRGYFVCTVIHNGKVCLGVDTREVFVGRGGFQVPRTPAVHRGTWPSPTHASLTKKLAVSHRVVLAGTWPGLLAA